MLNFAQIPGWTWIFVAMALIMGSILIAGVVIERRRSRSFKMVKRSSAYKRQVICKRALVAGLTISLIVALVGCASGGGITVQDSESSGFLPSVAPEETTEAVESEGTEPAAEEADPNALSKVSMTFDTTGVDFETLYKEAFGDREPKWANTSFTTRLPIRFDLSGYQDPFGFPIYADHDWLNGEYYQSLSNQIAEQKIISFDYLGTSESLKRRTELMKKQNAWREEFEETLTDEERIERVNEMRTQENLENILFTVMAFDALTEHEVFRKNNEEAIKAFEEFLEDIYDPEAEASEDQAVGLPRLAEWEDGYEPTGDALQDMEHILPSKNALKLKVFVQQLLTLDQETNGKIVTRKPSYYWTLEYSDNEKENATNPLLPSSSESEEEPEKTKKLPENFLRAVKKDGVEARSYIMYNVVRDGKTIFSYGIGVEDMSIAFFTSGKTSKTTTPTTPTPATKTYSARVQHRWADGRPGPGYPAIPFGDYYVDGLVTGSSFSYTAPIYPGCTVSLTAINATVEDHDLLYTIYYTAPKDRQKSPGGGGGSRRPNRDPDPDNPKPDQPGPDNPGPDNPGPKPDSEGGKTPTASTGGPGVVPDTKGPGENIEGDKDGGGQTVNIPNETAKNEDYTVTEAERNQQQQQEQESWASQGKGDSSGTGGQDHEVGGQLTTDAAQKTEGTGQTPSINVSGGTPATSAGENSGGNSHYSTSQTVDNGDGTTTTTGTSVNTSSGSVSSGMTSDDEDGSSQQNVSTASAGASQQSSTERSSSEQSNSSDSGKESSEAQSNTASSQGSSNSNSAGGSSASAASSSTGSSSSGASSGGGGDNTESSNGGASDNGGSNGGASSGMVSD